MNTTTDILALARELHARIARGELLEAFDELYADDVSMQENLNEPVLGHAANRERELAFIASIAEVHGYDVHAIASEGDITFVESTLRFRSTAGDEVSMTQVSRSRWRDGKIVEERFYHG
ncbi:MAG: ketosteroid isomerase-like protein [Planctomycetota bacterium]|jgi:ketosteroid isomerase-like protein